MALIYVVNDTSTDTLNRVDEAKVFLTQDDLVEVRENVTMLSSCLNTTLSISGFFSDEYTIVIVVTIILLHFS